MCDDEKNWKLRLGKQTEVLAFYGRLCIIMRRSEFSTFLMHFRGMEIRRFCRISRPRGNTPVSLAFIELPLRGESTEKLYFHESAEIHP